MAIRLMNMYDVSFVVSFFTRYGQGDGLHLSPPACEEDQERWLDPRFTRTVLVMEGTEIIGHGSIHVSQAGHRASGYITNVLSHPERRRIGVGSAIMEELERQARHLRCGNMMLHCQPTNAEAIRLYQRKGFTLREHTTCYWQKKTPE